MKVEITKLGDRQHVVITEVNGPEDMLAVSKLMAELKEFGNIETVDALGADKELDVEATL